MLLFISNSQSSMLVINIKNVLKNTPISCKSKWYKAQLPFLKEHLNYVPHITPLEAVIVFKMPFVM